MREKLEWIKFDASTLPEDMEEAYNLFRESEKKTKALKYVFVDMFRKAAEEAGMGPSAGMELIVSTEFDDISMAYKEKGKGKSSVERVGFGQKPKRNTRTLTPKRR
jgi:hypothetical protein